MVISDLLDLDQIRAVLTVSEADLPDDVMEDFGLADEIEDILDDRVPLWSEIVLPKLQRKLRVFVKYKAAATLALMAPVFVLKKMTDGANEGQRSDRDGFRWLAEELDAKAEKALAGLLEELDVEVFPGYSELVGVVNPLRDPITEPRE